MVLLEEETDERNPEDLDVPINTSKTLAEVDSILHTSIFKWMKKHGKVWHIALTPAGSEFLWTRCQAGKSVHA
jgi:hypothetical protein